LGFGSATVYIVCSIKRLVVIKFDGIHFNILLDAGV
jgi:hypothetical protein